MWCTQRNLAISDMMVQKAAYITRNATSATTFTDGVGGLAVERLKRGEVTIYDHVHVMQC